MTRTTTTESSPAETPKASRLWRFFGLRRRPGRRLAVLPNLWGYVLLTGTVLLVGSIAFAEYSMQPDFCRSCHIMEPYYQAWHDSSHKNVPCGDCHFEPGWQNTVKGKFEASSQAVKYITNTYGSKPHAEVRDESCQREGCHSERLLEGTVAWETTTERGDPITIAFNHTPHLENLRRGKELRCVSCHSQMVQGRHIAVTLDTCYTCHFKGMEFGRDEEVLGGCTSCHSAPASEIRLPTGVFSHADYVDRGVACFNCHSDSIRGNGQVPRQMCWNCHNQAQQIARYGEPAFVHRVHVSENKVECGACHVQIEHSISAGVPRKQRVLGTGSTLDHGGVCSQCHDSTHAGPDELYRGTGGRGVPDMPSPMYRAQVDCVACHRERLRTEQEASVVGQTFVAIQQSCDDCHGHRYHEILDVWKETVAEQLADAEAKVLDAGRALARFSGSSEDTLRLRRLLDEAEYNVRFVRLGVGVHNLNYTIALLSYAVENCDAILDDPGVAATSPNAEGSG